MTAGAGAETRARGLGRFRRQTQGRV